MLRFLLVLILFGVATYLLVRALQQRGDLPAKPTMPKRPQRPRPKKMVAPDDDEDFLRDLDKRRLKPEDPDN